MPKRTDANQAEIMWALRRCGAHVIDLHVIGGGVPDLLVWYDGRYTLVEIKTLEGKLNAREREWLAAWPGEVAVVRSEEEALRAVGIHIQGEDVNGT